MASSRFGRKLFYLTNCVPAIKRQQAAAAAAKGADAAVAEACGGRPMQDSSPWGRNYKRRTLASAAQELSPEEIGQQLQESGGRHGGRMVRGRGHSPLDLFESFFPNRSLRSMIDRMDRVFDDPFFNRSFTVPGSRSARDLLSRPPWDFVETEDAFKMRLDLPGLSKEEVKVYVEDGSLVIKGEHSEEKKAEQAEWTRASASHYSTRILLPDNANHEVIKAELKNGVLQVSIPKVAETEPTKNVIDVQVD